ncbi:unnamed protein product [Arctia plantaginis]|uniref:CHK kinase-like domain-containing protein n=1 Tax=Arctia plantaginis TaxID=874455 RepID=A0A8S0Z498_ARCPL|nr:unnamed protein product [Arctia plantaginis]
MVGCGKRLVLEEILTEKQILHILNQAIGGDGTCQLVKSEIRPAMDGIAGFLGDHLKGVLDVDVQGEQKKVYLFLKRISASNKPKAEFIDKHNFYRREMLMYRVLDDIRDDDSNPWCVRAYIYTDSIIVMPDLTVAGYTSRHFLDTLDYEHFYLTMTSIARFHAAFINYETKKSVDLKRPYSTFQEFSQILQEPTFCESPFLKAAAKLSTNLLKAFSTKFYSNRIGLESELNEFYLKACDSMKEYKGSANVLLHRDLWVNNIMFKYEKDVPINAVLVDFQCLRYGPPAFDLMVFMYLTTDRKFRQEHTTDVLNHYFSVFEQNLNGDSKKRLEDLGYDKEDFLKWCDKGRMFGMFAAIGIYPFILMDPKTAQETFDDPKTYDKYINFDRSEPVLAFAAKCKVYKDRNLEVTEEFVERYVLS